MYWGNPTLAASPAGRGVQGGEGPCVPSLWGKKAGTALALHMGALEQSRKHHVAGWVSLLPIKSVSKRGPDHLTFNLELAQGLSLGCFFKNAFSPTVTRATCACCHLSLETPRHVLILSFHFLINVPPCVSSPSSS